MRRFADILIASVLLLLLVPVSVPVILAIMVDSPGNPFYGGRRVGKNGRVFRMWKYRTMVKNADQIGSSIVTSTDPRVTRVGTFLRRTRIDELPQFYNLLIGDLTLIGPRAEVPAIVATYTAEQLPILSVKPGLTGPGTLYYLTDQYHTIDGEDDAETYYKENLMDEKLRIDLNYVRTQTLGSDLEILLRTVQELATRLRR